MKKLFVMFLMTGLLLGATAAILHVYFDRYSKMEKQIKRTMEYDASTANAIKHATAAADMFNLLRQVMNEEQAEKTVIRLGVFNEYLERVVYYGRTDSVREIMKDLHNNYAGIKAAKLDQDDPFRVILAFSDNRTLIIDQIYNPFFEEKSPEENVVAFSYDWFNEHHAEIDQRIQRKIMRARDLRPLAMQISNLSLQLPVIE